MVCLLVGAVFRRLTVAVLLIVFSQSGRIFFNFARESGIELRKVVWPSKEETLKLTGVVFYWCPLSPCFYGWWTSC